MNSPLFLEEFSMKYLVSCLIALPLITSCVDQEQYSERNYYAPVPRVEVQRNPNNNYHSNNGNYRPAPQGRVDHGHGGNNSNIVRHPSTSGSAVIVQGNEHEHGHGHDNNNAHGHDNNNAHGRPQNPTQSQGEVQETAHGHN